MDLSGKKIEIAESFETVARQREVQSLINIVAPDPNYQPLLLTDEASLVDAVATEPAEIARRLNAHFAPQGLELDIYMPIWQLVDTVRRVLPDWPEEDSVSPN